MMDDGKRDDAPAKKKAYQKPTLIEIALRPDEAVLGACKVSGVSGPGGSGNCHPVGELFQPGILNAATGRPGDAAT